MALSTNDVAMLSGWCYFKGAAPAACRCDDTRQTMASRAVARSSRCSASAGCVRRVRVRICARCGARRQSRRDVFNDHLPEPAVALELCFGEAAWIALLVGSRRAQEGADQPRAVHAMQREAVGVDAQGQQQPATDQGQDDQASRPHRAAYHRVQCRAVVTE